MAGSTFNCELSKLSMRKISCAKCSEYYVCPLLSCGFIATFSQPKEKWFLLIPKQVKANVNIYKVSYNMFMYLNNQEQRNSNGILILASRCS